MIHNVVECPFCRLSIGVDCATRRIVFDHIRLGAEPCEHLTCYWICLAVLSGTETDPRSTVSRLWEFGRGEYEVDGLKFSRHAALTHYLCDYGFQRLPPQLIPQVPHRLVGLSAQEREEQRRGSGEFDVTVDGFQRRASLDGWAVFARNPQTAMLQIAVLSDDYEV